MHERIGVPSTWTVQAPQCPSLHAIFVPVKPSSSRNTCARLTPIGASSSYAPPLTVSSSSGTRRHRHDVGEVDEARRRARDEASLSLVLGLGQRPPQVARGDQQLVNLLELRLVPVALV